MMSFRPCKKVHTIPLLKCSKIKYFIFIPTVCILLSFCIPFVSFAETVIVRPYNIDKGQTNCSSVISNSYPEWKYQDSIHVNLVPQDDSDIYKYFHSYTYNLTNNTTRSQVTQQFDLQRYNSFTTNFALVADLNEWVVQIQILNLNGSVVYGQAYNFNDPSGTLSDNYVNIAWHKSNVQFTVDGFSLTLQLISFSSFIVAWDNPDVIKCNLIFKNCFTANTTKYVEVINPIFDVVGNLYSSGDESSDSSDESGETSGGENQWEDNVEQELSDMNDNLVDLITGNQQLIEETSRHNQAEESFWDYLTSNDESLEVNSELESELEEFEDTTSIYNEYEQSLDNIIDGAFSDFSYDTSEFYDNINNAFSELNNDTSDISFVAFVESLWNFTGISTFLPIIGGFMVLAVLLKFVIGGVV